MKSLQPPSVWQGRSRRQSAGSVTDLQRRILEVLQNAQPMTAIDIARRCGLQLASDVNPSLYQLREQGVLHFDQTAKNVKPLWSLRPWSTDFEAKNCSVTWAKPSKSHAARSQCSWFLWRPIEVTGHRKALTKNEQSEPEREREREREGAMMSNRYIFVSAWVRVHKPSPKISMICHQTYSNMTTYMMGCSPPWPPSGSTSSCGIQRWRRWGVGALERLLQRGHAGCSDGGMRSPSGIQFEHQMKYEKYPSWIALKGSYIMFIDVLCTTIWGSWRSCTIQSQEIYQPTRMRWVGGYFSWLKVLVWIVVTCCRFLWLFAFIGNL